MALGADYPRDVTFSWTNPATFTNGDPLEVGDLTFITIYCGRNSQPTVGAADLTLSVGAGDIGAPQTATFASVITQPGKYFCIATAMVQDGHESDASNTSEKRYTGKPLPPQVFN